MKIAFIGSGVMGEAMIRGILGKGIITPKRIMANDISATRLSSLEKAYGVGVTDDYGIAVEGSDVIVIAVKPQNLPRLMPGADGLGNGQQHPCRHERQHALFDKYHATI